MRDTAEATIDAFLDQVAQRSPTPGGGSVTALAGALACALGRMVAQYSVTPRTDATTRTVLESVLLRLRRADQLLRALITRDAEVYAAMTDARRREKNGSADAREVQGAVWEAIGAPLEMAGAASAALATMNEFKPVASRYLLSDLGVAAVLAEAAARAAEYSVRVNLPQLTDHARRAMIVEDLERTVSRCAAYRNEIEAFVHRALQPEPPSAR